MVPVNANAPKGNGMVDHDEDLVARQVVLDPYHPGPGDVRLVDSGVPVWAIVGHRPALGGNVDQAANGYAIAPEAARAAVTYDHRNQDVIDARLAANSGRGVVGSTAAA